MNLAELQTFLAIVETGSLVRASEKLNITQSTVTARLKGLESELGRTLLHRHKSGAELTAAGLKFKRYAEVMSELWRQARLETALPPSVETVFNFGCHMDLWPGLGREIFDEIYRNHRKAAFTVWPGDEGELDRWLGTGLIDAALTYQPHAVENQSIHELLPERLVLFTTRKGSPMRFDPLYVYVDAGEEFGRQHTKAYTNADVSKVTFRSAVWALEHLLVHGGSAYLPERLATPYLAAGTLYRVADAPDFTRKVFLITNDIAANAWRWLPALVERLS